MWRASQSHFTYRASAYFEGEADETAQTDEARMGRLRPVFFDAEASGQAQRPVHLPTKRRSRVEIGAVVMGLRLIAPLLGLQRHVGAQGGAERPADLGRGAEGAAVAPVFAPCDAAIGRNAQPAVPRLMVDGVRGGQGEVFIIAARIGLADQIQRKRRAGLRSDQSAHKA